MRNRSLFGLLRIVPLWVALMSGSFSIVREVVALYSEHPSPFWQRNVFWACVWITFVVSAVAAWVLKNQELAAEKAKNTRPKFSPEILKLHVSHDVSTAQFQTVGSNILIEAYFMNERPKQSTVREFGLEITINKGKHEGRHFITSAERRQTLFNPIGAGGSGENVVNLNSLVNSQLFEEGKGERGFLLFKLADVTPQYLDGGIATLVITDAYGGEHRSEGFSIKTL